MNSYQSNDTLGANMCPNAGNALIQASVWQNIYAPSVATFLNSAAPGAGITPTDVTSIMQMCPFETIAKEKPSPFCALFNETAFEGIEYLGDLANFYGNG